MSNSNANGRSILSRIIGALVGAAVGVAIIFLLDTLGLEKLHSAPSTIMPYRVFSGPILVLCIMVGWGHHFGDDWASQDGVLVFCLFMLAAPYLGHRLAWAIYLTDIGYASMDEAFSQVFKFVMSQTASLEYIIGLIASYTLSFSLPSLSVSSAKRKPATSQS